MYRHRKYYCRKKENKQLMDKIDQMQTQLDKIQIKPQNIQNIQINNLFYITEKDDYFGRLKKLFKTQEEILTFVKSCALSKRSGDIRFFTKIHLPQGENDRWAISIKDNKILLAEPNGTEMFDKGTIIYDRFRSNYQNTLIKSCNLAIRPVCEQEISDDERECRINYVINDVNYRIYINRSLKMSDQPSNKFYKDLYKFLVTYSG